MTAVKEIFVVDFERVGAKQVMVVRSTSVLKETPQSFIIDDKAARFGYSSPFGYSRRVPKQRFTYSASDALRLYIAKRTREKDSAAAVVAQATAQIAEAEALALTL